MDYDAKSFKKAIYEMVEPLNDLILLAMIYTYIKYVR